MILSWFLEALCPPKCIISKKEGSWLSENFTYFPPAPTNQANFKYIDEIHAITGYYDPVVEKIVEHFKFQGFKQLATVMMQNKRETVPKNYLNTEYIVPIPLHWTRKIYRGYNQAEKLAKAASKELKVPVNNGLRRRKKTKQQARLKKDDRLKNLESAFIWKNSEIPTSIILIDDVVASGSTLDQAARACKKAGVKTVYGLVFARGGKNYSMRSKIIE